MKKIRKIENHTKANICLALTFAVFILGTIFYVPEKGEARFSNVQDISYVDLKKDLDSNAISCVYYSANSENCVVYVRTVEDEYYKITRPSYDEFEKMLYESGVIIKPFSELHFAEQTESNRFGLILTVGMILLFLSVVYKCKAKYSSFQESMIGRKSMVAGIDGSFPNESNKDGTALKTFADVAGLKEV